MANKIDKLGAVLRKAGVSINPKQLDELVNAISLIKKSDDVVDSAKYADDLTSFKSSINDIVKSARTDLSKYADDLSTIKRTSAGTLDNMGTALNSVGKAGSLTKSSVSKLKKLKKMISFKNTCKVALVGTGAYIVINAAINSGIHEFVIKNIQDYSEFTGTVGDVLVTVDSGFAFYDGSIRGTPADVINFTNTPTPASGSTVNLNTNPYSITHVIDQFNFIINVKSNIGIVTRRHSSSDSGYGRCSLYRSYEASLALQSMQVIGIAAAGLNTVLNVGLAGLAEIADTFFDPSSGIISKIFEGPKGLLEDGLKNLGGLLGDLTGGLANAAGDIAKQLADAAKAAAGAAGGGISGLFGGLAGIGSTFIYIVIAIVGIIIFLNVTKKKA